MTADVLLAAADELYALPMAEFTSARDARAKAVKKDDPKLSAAIKTLRKPSVAAWALGLLVRRQPDQVEQLLQVGAALRSAQDSLDGEQLRALTRQRRQLTAAVTAQLRGLAADHGQRLTDAVADQVEQTLTAAMLDEDAGRAVRSGLLVTALQPTLLDADTLARSVAVPEALGYLAVPRPAAAPAKPELHVVPDPEPDQTARRQAEERLAEARTTVHQAEVAREAAAERVAQLTARSLELAAAIDELRRQVADREAELERVDDDLVEAEEEADAAAVEHRSATQEYDAAQRAVDRL